MMIMLVLIKMMMVVRHLHHHHLILHSEVLTDEIPKNTPKLREEVQILYNQYIAIVPRSKSSTCESAGSDVAQAQEDPRLL